MSKAVEIVRTIIRATPRPTAARPVAPAQDDRIEPWGSIIHWQEIYRGLVLLGMAVMNVSHSG
jgi:hypothetical protein